MYYLIYKITNLLNNKIYIGTHKTRNKDDGYMGSGKYLLRAYKVYGLENFTKDILYEFDNPVDMYAKEAEIVNEDFLINENTYNLKRGGFGGFDYINENNLTYCHNFSKDEYSKSSAFSGFENNLTRERAENTRKARQSSFQFDSDLRRKGCENAKSPIAISKRKDTYRKISHQQGSNNSQYGSFWITDGISNIKVKNSDIPLGWRRGRTIKK